jgi:hypothetical protein
MGLLKRRSQNQNHRDERIVVYKRYDYNWIQALESVFHNAVERPVDNHVDKLVKRAIVALLDHIA